MKISFFRLKWRKPVSAFPLCSRSSVGGVRSLIHRLCPNRFAAAIKLNCANMAETGIRSQSARGNTALLRGPGGRHHPGHPEQPLCNKGDAVNGIQWLKTYFCVQFTGTISGIVVFVKTYLDSIVTLFFEFIKSKNKTCGSEKSAMALPRVRHGYARSLSCL